MDPFVPPLAIRLFGGVEIAIHGVPVHKLQSRKEYLLLALLILTPGHKKERAGIARQLWPDSDYEEQADRNLRRSLMFLRKALGTEGKRLFDGGDHLLALDLEGAQVDVLAFDQAMKSQDPAVLEAGLAYYTGPLLGDAVRSPAVWFELEREARKQSYYRAARTLREDAERRGDRKEVVRLCRLAVALDPAHEEEQCALMIALARDGEIEAVEAAFRQLKRLLKRQDLQPDPKTLEIYTDIRKGKYPVAPLPPASSAAEVGEWPHAINEILGREEEARKIRERLQFSRLVTLVGAGGLGKTRLALHLADCMAEEMGRRIWFVDLTPLTDPKLIPQAVLAALKQTEQPGRAPLQILREYLFPLPALLLLDNCEHLGSAPGQLANHLLTACPKLRILATSRHSLKVSGETVYRLPRLPIPDAASSDTIALLDAAQRSPAVDLFVKRAPIQPFALTAKNVRAVVQICARLEGIPLAIELAAAQMQMYTVAEIAVRLNDLFDFLVHKSPNVPHRQKTLRTLIDWSYHLLQGPEQRLMDRLSIFRGSWSLSMAQEVCAGEGIEKHAIPDLVESLVDKSLVMTEPGESGGMRFRLLEMIRLYMAKQFAAKPVAERERLRERYRDSFLALAERERAAIRGAQQVEALDRLTQEVDNFRTVLEQTLAAKEAEKGLRLVVALWQLWSQRGHYAEGRDWLQRALEIDPCANSALRGSAFNALGSIFYLVADFIRAKECFTAYLSIAQDQGNEYGMAIASAGLANILRDEAEYIQAQSLLEAAQKVFQKQNRQRNLAVASGNLALIAFYQNDYTRARALQQETLTQRRALEDPQLIAHALCLTAYMLLCQGDIKTALPYLQEALTLNLSLDIPLEFAICLSCFRHLFLLQKQFQKATLLLGIEIAHQDRRHLSVSPREMAEIRQHTTSVRTTLGISPFSVIYSQGYAMKPEQIEAFLRESLGLPGNLPAP